MAPLDLAGDQWNLFDWLGLGRGFGGAAAGERRIGKRKIAGDCSSVTVVLGKSSGARFIGAAAEIFAVVGHARFPCAVLPGNAPELPVSIA
jgi:hypothetical protein